MLLVCKGNYKKPEVGVKDPAMPHWWCRSQPWLRFDPWPGNFHMSQVWPKPPPKTKTIKRLKHFHNKRPLFLLITGEFNPFVLILLLICFYLLLSFLATYHTFLGGNFHLSCFVGFMKFSLFLSSDFKLHIIFLYYSGYPYFFFFFFKPCTRPELSVLFWNSDA